MSKNVNFIQKAIMLFQLVWDQLYTLQFNSDTNHMEMAQAHS